MTDYPPSPPPSGYGPPEYGQQYGQQPPPGPGAPPPPYGYPSPPGYGYGPAPAYGYGQYGPLGPLGPQYPRGGLATASLVLGIIGFVLACIPFVNYVAYPLVVLAIIFGILAIRWGKAKAGLILGSLGLLATVVWTIVIVAIFHHVSSDLQRFHRCVHHTSIYHQDRCNKYLDN
ncbi:hypothetical protein [Jatrophihabitans endophyticus]|uniref:hypothetical protein n=1 Tax=Jatrophihabitans endophyticus TaxID=1206085 RepID=UPI0019D9213F|nr:hypothetical protein [Jatrophihabitans endophyticus]MBE7189126.1 DUF4190 domain-containing protein [Jatrophihabitans endophyticus]